MAQERTNFWALERTNRRQTWMLVAVFVALFTLLGLGLDFVIGTLRVVPLYFTAGVNGQPVAHYELAGFPFLTIAALIVALIQSMISYYGGAALVLASTHAGELRPDSPRHQMVLDVVSEMALAARMPVPRAYLIDDPAPNAFATGRDPAHSVICVTQGLLDEMDREELQGVIGHELAHVRDYDIRTMTMIAVLVGGVALLADFFVRYSWFGGFGGLNVGGGRRGGQAGGDGANAGDTGEAGLVIAIVVFLLAVLAPLFSQLLAMAVSRRREYLADAASVEFTRNPRALLRALKEIARTESPLKNASRGTAHLFIVNPLEGAGADGEGFFDNLFSTHPPLSRRIERLQAMLGDSAPHLQPSIKMTN